jgi:hypothetical protein
MSWTCLLCGERGIADAALNVALFMPLGFLVAGRRRAGLVAGLAGAVLSSAIEVAQLAVPGRFPTLGDVVWNTAGAPAGVGVARTMGRLVATPSWHAATGAAVVVGGTFALGGWLLEHEPTPEPYFGQWTPDLAHMPRYTGDLLSATLDGRPVPRGPFPDEEQIAERVAADWTLEARVVKGSPPTAVSPIVSVFDAQRAEILLLGADEEDLVLRERTRAVALRLDSPDLRVVRALAAAPVGDTIELAASRRGDARCLARDALEWCGLGFTPGRTWGLFIYAESWSERARRLLDAAWLFSALGVVGILSPSWRALLLQGLITASLLGAAVAFTRLVVPPWWEAVSAFAGLAVGRLLASHLRDRPVDAPEPEAA